MNPFSGLPPFSYDELQKNIGGLVYPNGIAPDGMSQEQMFRQGVGQLGAGMLAASNKNPMQALGMSYLEAQNQGLNNARQTMIAKEFRSQEEDRKAKREQNEAMLRERSRIAQMLGAQTGGQTSGGAGGDLNTLYEAYSQAQLVGDEDLAQSIKARIDQQTKAADDANSAQKLSIDERKLQLDQTNQTLKVIEKPYEEAKAATSDLQAINTMEQLLDEGIFTGKTAGWEAAAKGFLAEAGWVSENDLNKLAGTEAYQAAAGQRVAQIVKQFGAGTSISNADREYADKMAAGKITMTEESMRKILGIGRKVAQDRRESYKKKWQPLLQGTEYGDAYSLSDVPEYTPWTSGQGPQLIGVEE